MTLTIQNVENMSATELVERTDEILEGLADVPQPDVVARYLQARTDAKVRDENQADQARTLEALQSGNQAIREQLAGQVRITDKLTHELAAADTARVEADKRHAEDMNDWAKLVSKEKDLVTSLRAEMERGLTEAAVEYNRAQAEEAAKIQALTERCERLAAQAKQSHAAMTGAQQVVITSLAAVQESFANAVRDNEIDKADRGE